MASGSAATGAGAVFHKQELPIEWDFSGSDKTETVSVCPAGTGLLFHANFSSGTAVILCRDAPLTKEHHHYWELEMESPIYGSAVMVGLGTKDAQVHAHTDVFAPVIGIDKSSWGYSHIGQLHHDCRNISYHPAVQSFYPPGHTTTGNLPRQYGSSDKNWKEGSIIGVYFDSWKGQVEFYHNRTPLGIAFTGLPRDVDLYPMVSATSAKTKMRLICAQKYPARLAFECARTLCKSKMTAYSEPYFEYTCSPHLLYAQNNKFQHNLLMNKRHMAKWTKTLPPLLRRFINDNCWFLIGCKFEDLEKDSELQRNVKALLAAAAAAAAADQESMVIVSSDEETNDQATIRPKSKRSPRQRTGVSHVSSSSDSEEGFAPLGPNPRRTLAEVAGNGACRNVTSVTPASRLITSVTRGDINVTTLAGSAPPDSPDSLKAIASSSDLVPSSGSEDDMLIYFRPSTSASASAGRESSDKSNKRLRLRKKTFDQTKVIEDEPRSDDTDSPAGGGSLAGSKGGYSLRKTSKGKR